MRRSSPLRVAALAAAAVLVLAPCSGDDAPEVAVEPPAPSPSATPDPECPLTGKTPQRAELAERPAVAIKVENDPIAYPLSGLEDAEVVFEELVEGGVTRFLAIYHCTDAGKVGPVRSARVVDPGIMIPITRILGAAGGNQIVRKELKKAGVVVLDEKKSKKAMRRVPRPGIPLEHTLYADTRAIRQLGQKRFDDPPVTNLEFGPLKAKGKKTRGVTINFGGESTVDYTWSKGEWKRFDNGSPLLAEGGGQIGVDNVVIEQHTINNSRTIVDVGGNPSIEIKDQTGKGTAVLLRDGKAIAGRWIRKSLKAPVRFVTKTGDTMVFAPGTIWVELVPDRKGEIKGSFSLK